MVFLGGVLCVVGGVLCGLGLVGWLGVFWGGCVFRDLLLSRVCVILNVVRQIGELFAKGEMMMHKEDRRYCLAAGRLFLIGGCVGYPVYSGALSRGELLELVEIAGDLLTFEVSRARLSELLDGMRFSGADDLELAACERREGFHDDIRAWASNPYRVNWALREAVWRLRELD